jgi:5,10-methylenetetrahydromethanopterin reductase
VPERIRWGIGLVRDARRKAGLDPGAIAFGAYVNLVCHPDRAMARALVKGGLTTFARFSVMHGEAAGPLATADETTLARLHDGYDMTQHTRADSGQARLLPDDFIDRFAIAGDVDYCVRRIAELNALGIDKVIVSGPTAGTNREEARRAMALADEQLVQAVRALA